MCKINTNLLALYYTNVYLYTIIKNKKNRNHDALRRKNRNVWKRKR